jgi:release factor glutamine methyltransferase
MLTVLEAINKSVDFLSKKQIESPRINAELFLASILDCKRLDLYIMYDRPLSEEELNQYREYLKRRSTFEPLQYIIGKVEFYGIQLKITPDVLIPRPETEILVDTVINIFRKNDSVKILDIGSGSGNISIALAANLPNVVLTGIDISKKSISVANENSELLKLNHRISFFQEDIFDFNIEKYAGYDVVISNPPYVSKTDYLELQTEIKDFEPDFAVTDFSDGYTFYKRIIDISKKILKPGGKIFFEIAKGQSEIIKDFLIQDAYKNVFIVKDYQGIERVISGEKT